MVCDANMSPAIMDSNTKPSVASTIAYPVVCFIMNSPFLLMDKLSHEFDSLSIHNLHELTKYVFRITKKGVSQAVFWPCICITQG